MNPPIIHNCQQGSEEWMALRLGRPTASELCNLLTPEFKAKTGETPAKYLAEKVAEKWRGQLNPGFSSWATNQGTLREPSALAWYEFAHNVGIHSVGFVQMAEEDFGCSPDGLIGDDCGIEIKCPEPPQHVRYVIEGKVPKDYIVQVHASMYATGRPRWVFMSYHPDFPKLVIEVKRDSEIQEKICKQLAVFYGEFAHAMNKLRELDK